MLKLCLSIAAGIAWAQVALAAGAREPELPAPEPPIQQFYVNGPAVDGMPTYHLEWRVWTNGGWVALTSAQGQHTLFGISEPDPRPAIVPAPPIPKHQRRLE